MKRKNVVIFALIVVAAIAIFLIVKFALKNGFLPGSFYGNPANEIPDTNPFQANTNPFKGGYKNPFSE